MRMRILKLDTLPYEPGSVKIAQISVVRPDKPNWSEKACCAPGEIYGPEDLENYLRILEKDIEEMRIQGKKYFEFVKPKIAAR
ncbi:MAG: hypothetical protein HQ568_09340 [Calditrichaeota bacterium]|nr:hypothetical protein [Calditrichota bacterium]